MSQAITFKVRAKAAGRTSEFSFEQDVTAGAPESVKAGEQFEVVIDPGANTVPAEAGGHKVKQSRDLVLVLPVPTNATYVSASTSGGAGLNSEPSVALQGSNVVLTVPGPIPGGANYELPAVTITLTAGESGTIESRMGGTSFDDPGLTFTVSVKAAFLTVDAHAVGYPDPSPTLTTTTIT